MQFSNIIFLTTLLSAGAFAKNSKFNQYLSIDDCKSDKNIISHASPPAGSCHSVDGSTKVVYLMTGDGAAGYGFVSFNQTDCGGDIGGVIGGGTCVELSSGVKGINFESVV